MEFMIYVWLKNWYGWLGWCMQCMCMLYQGDHLPGYIYIYRVYIITYLLGLPWLAKIQRITVIARATYLTVRYDIEELLIISHSISL